MLDVVNVYVFVNISVFALGSMSVCSLEHFSPDALDSMSLWRILVAPQPLCFFRVLNEVKVRHISPFVAQNQLKLLLLSL